MENLQVKINNNKNACSKIMLSKASKFKEIGLLNKNLYKRYNRLNHPNTWPDFVFRKSFTDQPERVILKNGQVIKENVIITEVKLSCK